MTQPSTTPIEHISLTARDLLDRLIMLANDPRLQDLLSEGYQHHGEAFIAFIAGTEGLYVNPGVMIDTFTNSYVTKTDSLAKAWSEAFEGLIAVERIELPKIEVIDQGVTEFLRQYVDELRERIVDRFDFVEGIDHWFVFGSTKITPNLR